MMLTFRPIKQWPEGWREPRGRLPSPFQASYSSTIQLLDRELWQLGASDALLQVDARESDVRLDGQLKERAQVHHPGVILTIETAKHGTLVYATDRFQHWQANLRAIALGLEALRKVERYGIADRGQQYAGYRELGSGIALGGNEPPMTLDQAAALLAEAADERDGRAAVDPQALLGDGALAAACYKRAAKLHHPDKGGDHEGWVRISKAYEVLKEHAG